MTNTEKRIKFIQRFAELTLYAKVFEIEFIVTTFFRSLAKQQALYDAGKSQVVRNSKHRRWLAIDICLIRDWNCVWNGDEYRLLGEQWKRMGGIWGGDWESLNDIYHFQAGETSEWFQA